MNAFPMLFRCRKFQDNLKLSSEDPELWNLLVREGMIDSSERMRESDVFLDEQREFERGLIPPLESEQVEARIFLNLINIIEGRGE